MNSMMTYRAMRKTIRREEKNELKKELDAVELARALGQNLAMKKATNLEPGDRIYDRMTCCWETVKEVSCLSKNSKGVEYETTSWLWVSWVGIFSHKAAVRRFASDGYNFYVKE